MDPLCYLIIRVFICEDLCAFDHSRHWDQFCSHFIDIDYLSRIMIYNFLKPFFFYYYYYFFLFYFFFCRNNTSYRHCENLLIEDAKYEKIEFVYFFFQVDDWTILIEQ